MRHLATRGFWRAFEQLPRNVQVQAEKSFGLLRADSRHPSLRLKRIGQLWSVRIGLNYRALATEQADDALSWFWIGTHAEYDEIIR